MRKDVMIAIGKLFTNGSINSFMDTNSGTFFAMGWYIDSDKFISNHKDKVEYDAIYSIEDASHESVPKRVYSEDVLFQIEEEINYMSNFTKDTVWN